MQAYPGGRSSGFPRPPNNQEGNGFGQGVFNMNTQATGSYADRQNRRGNLPPSLNSAAFGHNQQQNIGEPTPGTAFDMNFTPLLPSQLLLGSPFQPGSPGFASPQFASFASFQQSNNQIPQNYINTQQGPMSPGLYQSLQSPTFGGHFMDGPQSPTFNQSFAGQLPAGMHGTSRTVYLGNIPPDTSAEEILSHVRSGQIESVRLLPDKNCAFISFLDGQGATHFHSDAILKKLSIKGQDVKVGWGKPSQVPTSVALAVQQAGASRNVYLGNLPEEMTEEELREDLGKFGPIDTIKLVKDKNIGFVHFLSIGNAIKAVSQLPQEPNWQAPRRVYYGKDRCAYVSKTQQQNAAQYLGIAPGYANMLNDQDRELISNALAQQSVAAAAVATTAGGVTNLGNRTVYLGNIHPETTLEEICNVVRGGLLHHVRYIPEKHICFVTFIDPTAAASFYALSNLQGLMIHNRRLKIGWGKHSGALPAAIALAVSGGASRNVYIGNLDETWTEEKLRADFSEYGEIELVNALREKSCAFVNFTNIANAIKAIEGMRGKDEYKRFKINFGKDRCGNAPRQNANGQQQQQQQQQQQHAGLNNGRESISQSPLNVQPNGMDSPARTAFSPPPGSTGSASQNGAQQLGPTPSAILNAGNNNPLTMYLTQVQQGPLDGPADPYTVATLQQQQHSALTAQQTALHGGSSGDLLSGSVVDTPTTGYAQSSGAFSGSAGNGGLLVPNARAQHNRAISLPAFTQEPFGNGNGQAIGQSLQPPTHRQQQSSFSGMSSGLGGFANAGFGLAIGSSDGVGKSLGGWNEESMQ
jgi:RNA recognition motif-containing protein